MILLSKFILLWYCFKHTQQSGVERAVWARVTAAWRRWQEILTSLLVKNRSIGLRTRGRVQYMKLVWDQLYCIEQKHGFDKETEGWFYTHVIAECAGVRWQDVRCSNEVAGMCGIEDFSVKLGREFWDGLDIWKGQRGVCCVMWKFGDDGRLDGLGKSGVIVWRRIWTCWKWMWCSINGWEGDSSPVQPYPRWENVDIKWEWWWWTQSTNIL